MGNDYSYEHDSKQQKANTKVAIHQRRNKVRNILMTASPLLVVIFYKLSQLSHHEHKRIYKWILQVDKEPKTQEKPIKEKPKKKAEQEGEKAEKEAKEQAEKEAREAKEQADKEAREAKEQTEQEARKAKEQAEREAKEKANQEAKEQAEKEASEAKGQAEKEARENNIVVIGAGPIGLLTTINLVNAQIFLANSSKVSKRHSIIRNVILFEKRKNYMSRKQIVSLSNPALGSLKSMLNNDDDFKIIENKGCYTTEWPPDSLWNVKCKKEIKTGDNQFVRLSIRLDKFQNALLLILEKKFEILNSMYKNNNNQIILPDYEDTATDIKLDIENKYLSFVDGEYKKQIKYDGILIAAGKKGGLELIKQIREIESIYVEDDYEQSAYVVIFKNVPKNKNIIEDQDNLFDKRSRRRLYRQNRFRIFVSHGAEENTYETVYVGLQLTQEEAAAITEKDGKKNKITDIAKMYIKYFFNVTEEQDMEIEHHYPLKIRNHHLTTAAINDNILAIGDVLWGVSFFSGSSVSTAITNINEINYKTFVDQNKDIVMKWQQRIFILNCYRLQRGAHYASQEARLDIDNINRIQKNPELLTKQKQNMMRKIQQKQNSSFSENELRTILSSRK